ncbi:hypothetical protein DdX_11745 [Ditylenchus destructor]|uniref:Uncharacterized protein n=1 Tax=Ditylenchus destructor TaxID=166010 RepID=A0AAD4MZN1_9BILA|nr:hypothetical protein DdX_11745 [Ditylenchus destructor]
MDTFAKFAFFILNLICFSRISLACTPTSQILLVPAPTTPAADADDNHPTEFGLYYESVQPQNLDYNVSRFNCEVGDQVNVRKYEFLYNPEYGLVKLAPEMIPDFQKYVHFDIVGSGRVNGMRHCYILVHADKVPHKACVRLYKFLASTPSGPDAEPWYTGLGLYFIGNQVDPPCL